MAVARAERGQLIRVSIDRTAHVREPREEAPEPRRRDDLEDPARLVARVPEGVPLVAWLEDEVPRPRFDDLVAQQGAHPPLEDVAVLVLARVQVQRRRERARRHRVLDEREALAGLEPVDHEAHADAPEEALLPVARTYELDACGCRLHLVLLSLYISVNLFATIGHGYSSVKRNGDDANIRAEAASRASGTDAAANRGCGGRAPQDGRAGADDRGRHRRASGRNAPDGVRALPRRRSPLSRLLRPRARDGTAARPAFLALDPGSARALGDGAARALRLLRAARAAAREHPARRARAADLARDERLPRPVPRGGTRACARGLAERASEDPASTRARTRPRLSHLAVARSRPRLPDRRGSAADGGVRSHERRVKPPDDAPADLLDGSL